MKCRPAKMMREQVEDEGGIKYRNGNRQKINNKMCKIKNIFCREKAKVISRRSDGGCGGGADGGSLVHPPPPLVRAQPVHGGSSSPAPPSCHPPPIYHHLPHAMLSSKHNLSSSHLRSYIVPIYTHVVVIVIYNHSCMHAIHHFGSFRVFSI